MMRVRSLLLPAVFAGLVAVSARGAGFESSVVGSSAGSMAGTFRAIADDWSAAYYNPAGYAFFQTNEIGVTWSFLHLREEVNADYGQRDLVSGDRYDVGIFNDQTIFNRHEISPVPSMGLVSRFRIGKDTTVIGFSIYKPFDYKISWDLYRPLPSYNDTLIDRLPDRQYLTDLDVTAFQLTLARKLQGEKLAVGLGLQVLRVNLNYYDLVFRPNPLSGDVAARPRDLIAELPRNEGTSTGFGFNIGVLYKASPKFSAAATLSVPFETTVSGTTILNFIMPKYIQQSQYPLGSVNNYFTSGSRDTIRASFKTKLKLPTSFGAGLAFHPDDRLTIAADLNYTLWSSFKGLQFTYSDFSRVPLIADSVPGFFTANLNHPVKWSDAARFSGGVQYKLSSLLTILAGTSIDQSVDKDGKSATPGFVDTGDKFQISGGLRANLKEGKGNNWVLTAGMRYTKYPELSATDMTDLDGDGTIDTFRGTFRAKAIEPLLSLTYRF